MRSLGSKGPPDDEAAESVRRAVHSSILRGKEPRAICLYGSRVAGYAKPDSDYDAIIAVEGYKPKVRYFYIDEPLAVSALVVDSHALLLDAKKASLGEFVAGRLLNRYLAVQGHEFLEEVEVELKKRVIVESIKELTSIYGDFMGEVKIPLEYFLFEKLKKRASLYPPVSYSYAKTYGGELKGTNLVESLKGFTKAAAALAKDGIISLEGGFVRIRDMPSGFSGLARFSSAMTQTRRGITHYAVHGYAGRVSLEVIRREALSKISRDSDSPELPPELRNPKELWKLDEGILIVDDGSFTERLSDELGLGKPRKVTEEAMGEIYDTCKLLTLEDERRKVSLVGKRFSDPKSVKWAFVSVWALPGRRFVVSPMARLYNEYVAIRALRKAGLNTPEVVAVLLNDKVLVSRYVEGKTLGELVTEFLKGKSGEGVWAIQEYGNVLATAHSLGYSLGDTKPANTVLHQGRLYITDLEQSGREGDKAWDLAEFIYYSTKLILNVEGSRRLAELFLQGYLRRGEKEVVRKSLSLRYLAPFQPFMIPQVISAVRGAVRGMLGA